MNTKLKFIVVLFCLIIFNGCKQLEVKLRVSDVEYLDSEQIKGLGLEKYAKYNDLIRLSVFANYDIDKIRDSDGYVTQFFIYKCRDVSREALIDSKDREAVISINKVRSNEDEISDNQASSTTLYEIISTFSKNDSQLRDVVSASREVCVFSRLLNMIWVKSLSEINRVTLHADE